MLGEAAAAGMPHNVALLDAQLAGGGGLAPARAINAEPRLAQTRLVLLTVEHVERLQPIVRVETRETPAGPIPDLQRSAEQADCSAGRWPSFSGSSRTRPAST